MAKRRRLGLLLLLPDQHLSDRVDSSAVDLISTIMSYTTISL